tara:strand:- start:1348 stop:2007 length:660 start_codon:yes stop_codon:yes gene_type:complete
MKNNFHFVFDLDDTLYKEIDFVKSAYEIINKYLINNYNIDIKRNINYCLKKKINLFDNISRLKEISDTNFDLQTFLKLYRYQMPSIKIDPSALSFLESLKNFNSLPSLITDGRSITQRNKIRAMGISNNFKNILISEEVGYSKTNTFSFEKIMSLFPDSNFIYVGDNTQKDFLVPNKLGWETCCLIDDGRNIHMQDFELKKEYLPKHKINNILELDRFF